VVGKVLNLRASALHNHNFQAISGVEVDVRGRQHLAVIVMLGLDQALRETGLMVVINHRERPDHDLVAGYVCLDGMLAHQVTNRLRATPVPLLRDYPVKPGEKAAVE
jgi:hypothetical protein